MSLKDVSFSSLYTLIMSDNTYFNWSFENFSGESDAIGSYIFNTDMSVSPYLSSLNNTVDLLESHERTSVNMMSDLPDNAHSTVNAAQASFSHHKANENKTLNSADERQSSQEFVDMPSKQHAEGESNTPPLQETLTPKEQRQLRNKLSAQRFRDKRRGNVLYLCRTKDTH